MKKTTKSKQETQPPSKGDFITELIHWSVTIAGKMYFHTILNTLVMISLTAYAYAKENWITAGLFTTYVLLHFSVLVLL